MPSSRKLHGDLRELRRGSISPVLLFGKGSGTSLRSTSGRYERHQNALTPTTLGLAFARQVAAYIVHWKDRGAWGWGVDQLALFSAYAYMSEDGRAPHTLFLDDRAMNDRHGDTGMIRFKPGIGKYAPLNEDGSAP